MLRKLGKIYDDTDVELIGVEGGGKGVERPAPLQQDAQSPTDSPTDSAEEPKRLVDLEEDFTAEPGARDSATHVIAVVHRD